MQRSIVRHFLRELRLFYYHHSLGTDELITTNSQLTTPGPLSNLTLITEGSVEVTRPDGTQYLVTASPEPVDMSYIQPGFYSIRALEPTTYVCLGPISPTQPLPKLNTRFVHHHLTQEQYLDPVLVAEGSLVMVLEGTVIDTRTDAPLAVGTYINHTDLTEDRYLTRGHTHLAVLTPGWRL